MEGLVKGCKEIPGLCKFAFGVKLSRCSLGLPWLMLLLGD